VPLPLESDHCSSLSGGTNRFFFSDNDSFHIWQLKPKRSQGEFKLFLLLLFPLVYRRMKIQVLKTPGEPECLRVVTNGNIFHSYPFLHVKIPTEHSHSPWHPETSSSGGDKNTDEQLHTAWRDGQSILRVVVRRLKSVSQANVSASSRKPWF